MRIVLIQPPIQDFYDTDVRLQPIGLCFLKAVAKKYHPDVEVLIRDFHHGWGRRTLPVPTELEYLKAYYDFPDRSPFSTFNQYFHFGASFEEIGEQIKLLQPDAIGISSLSTPYYREVLQTARAIRKMTKAPIVVGGSHASSLPDTLLSDPAVDYVIRGEGEKPFVEWIEYLKGQRTKDEVSGLSFMRDGKIIHGEQKGNYSIDEIPIPDLSDFSPNTYSHWGRPMAFMITSRSCPHRCSFCSVHLTFGYRYRRRDIHSVLEEIELRRQQGYKIIDFEDDNLTFYKDQMKELCRALIKRYSPGELEFTAMNGISYLSLDEEMLELMRAAGFSHLNLALVSSDKSVRESTKRPHTIDKFVSVVDQATRLGFEVVAYQILGLPNETLESMMQTMSFLSQQPVLLGASPFYRTPNSPIAKGLRLNEEDYFKARLTAMAVETEHVSRDQLYTLLVCTHLINYLKGKSFSGREIDVAEVLMSDPYLYDLFIERRVYKVNKSVKSLNNKFDWNVFARWWSQTPWVTTKTGQRIHLTNSTMASATRMPSQAALVMPPA